MKINLYSLVKSEVKIERLSTTAKLDDGSSTTVHIVRYDKRSFTPEIIAFEKQTYLLEYCTQLNAPEAISGGFFMQATQEVLGDLWIHGVKRPSTGIRMPWAERRGTVHINKDGELSLGPRSRFPQIPENSLFQAGPMLLRDGEIVVSSGNDPEGVSAGSQQFDSNITVGRYPRASLGVSSKFIWSVVCDGRSDADTGLTLEELASIFKILEAQDAINLDGGGSATQISNGSLRNHPREDAAELPKGRPIHNAVVFYLR
jgi:exopolysaccharide biosynthesis protein